MKKVELKVLTTDEMGAIPRPRWLIEDFIAEKSTTMIYGPWGLGKSFMTLDMILSATVGGDWNGRKIDRPLKTMFIVAEGAAWWYRRVLAYEEEHGTSSVDRGNVVWIPQPVDLYNAGNAEFAALEAAIELHRPDVLIVDTWVRCSAAYGMNEDKATDTAKAYKNLDYLRDKYDVAPVIVHHPTKSGGSRGSGNQEASVERVIALKEVEGSDTMFDVVDQKGNHMEAFSTFRMVFKSVDLGHYSEDLSSAVVLYDGLAPSGDGTKNEDKLYNAVKDILPADGWTQKEFMGRSAIPDGSVSASLRSLVTQGRLEKIGKYYRKPE